MTKIQKKKAAARTERQRADFLASLARPIIVVHSPGLEAALRPLPPPPAPLCFCGLHPQHSDGYCPAEQTARESHTSEEA